MTGAVLAVAVLAFLGLGAAAIAAMVRHERAWRTEQPSWWRRPIDSPGLRQSVRRADEPSPYEVVSLRDPRVIGARVTARRTRPDVFKLTDKNPMGRRVDRRAARKVQP